MEIPESQRLMRLRSFDPNFPAIAYTEAQFFADLRGTASSEAQRMEPKDAQRRVFERFQWFIERYDDFETALAVLPEIAEVTSHDELKRLLHEHLEETRGHSERLKQIFDREGESPAGQTCEATQGLVSEAREMILAEGDDAVRDAGLIACLQRIEHYEMAGYGCARTFAEALGDDEAAGLLRQTLEEEKSADERYNRLAKEIVNPDAQ